MPCCSPVRGDISELETPSLGLTCPVKVSDPRAVQGGAVLGWEEIEGMDGREKLADDAHAFGSGC